MRSSKGPTWGGAYWTAILAMVGTAFTGCNACPEELDEVLAVPPDLENFSVIIQATGTHNLEVSCSGGGSCNGIVTYTY